MSRSTLMTPERVRRTVTRLAYEVIERNRGVDGLLVFGLKSRGAALADLLADALEEASGEPIERHGLSIAGFRDDRDVPSSRLGGSNRLDLPADAPSAEGRDVLLVDDVLFTGRTVRAALDAVLQYGRPRTIRLAVLVDRGHREVPVHPDFVGRVIPTKHAERVVVDPSTPAVYLDD
ncbi:bifunctional pyr operon transcriptional regulator/uracil phosphoribosyltransferase PyrR [Rubrivirga sp.]|uniref:bifunctional pyr operon transcriptional regulator/uracil phosphoribosyltransferase PyrR n=1 Tax=Rubrivirga sp. TaxID=1885344 RepID=UPI003B52C6C8